MRNESVAASTRPYGSDFQDTLPLLTPSRAPMVGESIDALIQGVLALLTHVMAGVALAVLREALLWVLAPAAGVAGLAVGIGWMRRRARR